MREEQAVILNVDDNEAARYTKTRFLQQAGFEVIDADSGSAALRLIDEAKPTLVVLDVRLPDMSGLEVCAKIKAHPQHASTLVIQTSASFIESRDRVAALDLGADMYLVEPMDADEFIAVVRAMLRLRAAERKAALSDRRFELLARSAPVGIFHTDADGACLYVNDSWCRITGLTPQTGLGQAWREALHPEDRPRVVREFLHAASHKAAFQSECRFVKPDGNVSWVWGEALPELNESGALSGYMGSITDITERKHAEEKLRAADRNKDEFLAMLSHELRNPLAPLRTTLEILRLKTGTATVSRELEVMDRQLRHLTRLTDDLFDVARFAGDRVPLRIERLELCQVVDAAVETSRPLLHAAGHAFDLDEIDPGLVVEGDRVRLAQVISNLLNNAAKFTPRGGEVQLGVRREDDSAVITVRDNGMGIPADALSQIFELFTQVNAPQAQPGLGIGLALAKRIVDLHGGSLIAHSAGADAGSEFVVRLPLAPGNLPLGSTEKREHASERPRPRRVLVVDDNSDASASLALLLQIEGHEVRAANEGSTALEIAAAFRPDVVLLDIGMPGMTGHEVARRIRSQQWGRTVVLIAVTGWGQEADRRLSNEAGFDHHLVKPVDLTELTQLLEQRAVA